MDARQLAKSIRNGDLSAIVPKLAVFDRIEVSNIMDAEYVGIPNMPADWAPLLRRSNDADFVGSSMNWCTKQPGSQVSNSDNKVMERVMGDMKKHGRVCTLIHRPLASSPHHQLPNIPKASPGRFKMDSMVRT
jgi:hypothetical protein